MSLPGILQEIAEDLGEEAALRFAARLGGTQIYVRRDEGGLLRDILGDELAAWLADRYGGEIIIVPMAKALMRQRHRELILSLSREGLGADEIARRLGCTSRWVREVVRQAGRASAEDEGTLPLFSRK